MKDRRGSKTFLVFLTLWAVLVYFCNLAVDFNVLKHTVNIKPWEKILLITALPSLAVLVTIVVYKFLRLISYSSNSVSCSGYGGEE